MKKNILQLTIALLASFITVKAEVTPVNIVLHDDNNSYQIPAGKVLLIEHFIWALESNSTHQVVSIKPSNDLASVGSFLLKFTTEAPDMWTPPRPIRVIGGSGAQVSIIGDDDSAVDWRNVMVVGLLVDPEDLYAKAIPSDLSNPRVEQGRLLADVKFASPRPRVTKVLSTEDLQGLEKDTAGQVVETESPSKAIVSVTADTAKKFIAVEAVARPSK